MSGCLRREGSSNKLFLISQSKMYYNGRYDIYLVQRKGIQLKQEYFIDSILLHCTIWCKYMRLKFYYI